MLLRQRALPQLLTVPAMPSVVADYVALTKPVVISLLLVTALGGMFLAEQGVPSAQLLIWVMVGGALGAGGANALNHCVERDIDKLMVRTRGRPVAAHRIGPVRALVFGIWLNLMAFLILAVQVNLLSAGLTAGAALFYVLVYTLWLKRITTQNVVIGGAAGAIPPMVGWTAVTGQLDLPAFYLFAIVFFWTPPHFWALSLLIWRDYARARIPMLPVVKGVRKTTWNILLYSILLVALTLLFFTTRAVDWVYLGGAVALGALFMYFAWRLWRRGKIGDARSAYLYSLIYLAGLFVAMMVDSTVSI
ncbi:MAG: heme o synthase [Dehalococcoidia bacterium]